MIDITFDATAMERALMKAVGPDAMRLATARAVTRIVTAARADIVRQLPSVFDRPTPFTERSVRYEVRRADGSGGRVYISEDANRGVNPRSYLGPEIVGGARRAKRSERAMMMKGIIGPDQRWMPSTQLTLDRYGNVPGSLMVQILSRISAFGEQGYAANATEKTKARLRRQKKATLASGTDYFVARNKRDGRNLGVWQLVGPGQVRPVLIFVNRAPQYTPRFPFRDMAFRIFDARFAEEMHRAILEGVK